MKSAEFVLKSTPTIKASLLYQNLKTLMTENQKNDQIEQQTILNDNYKN